MKKIFSYVSLFVMALAMTTGFASCSSDDNNDSNPSGDVSEKTAFLQTVTTQIVDATIHDTYKGLADSTELLASKISEMREAAKDHNVTQAQVDEACKLFLGARANYEKSEAFLLGAASQYNVDPHIDSWPLDIDALETAMNSPKIIAALDADGSDATAYGLLGQNVLGFHGIEFILFTKGQPRTAAQFNGTEKDEDHQALTCTGEEELIYAAAAAGDLRNACYILECGWNPESNSKHAAYLDDIEMNYTMSNGNSFGDDFKNAGKAGSSYATVLKAISAILVGDQGARGICDEVADSKIGKPFNGATDEDKAYIESPYSYNSITDFYDNITSIEDVWFGGMAKNRDTSKSLSAYFAKYHAAEGKAVEAAIAKAKEEINKMPHPFVLNRTAEQNGVAIKACKALSDALNAANTAMQND